MPKNIVVCCDGTDCEVATDSTNVLRIFRMLERDQRQVAYYDAGVGTLVDPEAISRWRKFLSRRLDAAIGLRVRENVIAVYRFLAQTYQPDDQIYLFGFSRGAYTVRAVAGMINFLGLVRPEVEDLATWPGRYMPTRPTSTPSLNASPAATGSTAALGSSPSRRSTSSAPGTPSARSVGSGTFRRCRTPPITR
jgi:Uncharacterized alpha/beta hydrolase domain (DUF2235)